MNIGDFYTFDPGSRDREFLPVIPRDSIGKPVAEIESTTIQRIHAGDLLRVVHDNQDGTDKLPGSVFVSHPAINGYGITFTSSLKECEQPPTQDEL